MPAFLAHSQMPVMNGFYSGQLGMSPFQGAWRRGLHSSVLNMDQELVRTVTFKVRSQEWLSKHQLVLYRRSPLLIDGSSIEGLGRARGIPSLLIPAEWRKQDFHFFPRMIYKYMVHWKSSFNKGVTSIFWGWRVKPMPMFQVTSGRCQLNLLIWKSKHSPCCL